MQYAIGPFRNISGGDHILIDIAMLRDFVSSYRFQIS